MLTITQLRQDNQILQETIDTLQETLDSVVNQLLESRDQEVSKIPIEDLKDIIADRMIAEQDGMPDSPGGWKKVF